MQEPIFHFTTKLAWEAAQKTGSHTDKSLHNEGFIHCSHGNQVARSLDKHAPKEEGLVLLLIDPDKVDAPIAFENTSGGLELYPHIYGALNTDAVAWVFDLKLDANGRFIMPFGNAAPKTSEEDLRFIREAIRLAKKGMEQNEGGPFGAVVVKDGKIVGRGNNIVTSTNDPTAHAEVTAIRDACKNLSTFQLDGCVIYTSCEPCPMCLGAIYWARPERIVYACSREDAAAINFDDDFIYREIPLPIEQRAISMVQLLREEGKTVFQAWAEKVDRIVY